ncbi:hypothetical protein A2Z10_02605 [Candidatus Azambacteria bacterium RBG_16_47_10]|uniref:Uncharacterized protein n=1 Tax=Candidatus Azambacteria bacterium RBG_16_47_10 TaxID=1797292 RepID=A0A1F5B1H2_9BACT|nr:MAG: hypothetical protein A2Z10_02605 [Candidatus Azambacteria bacterium RBG_16_47_10]
MSTITVFLTTKDKVIHSFSLEKDEDFVYILDKFLKKNKLSVSDCKKLSVSCAQEESMLCRIVTVSAAAISSRF